MSGGGITSCQTAVSTIFVFESPAYQNACNTVYLNVSTTFGNTRQNSFGNTNYIKFKTDLERMQYILGQAARQPGCG
jgi:hypothetical protein